MGIQNADFATDNILFFNVSSSFATAVAYCAFLSSELLQRRRLPRTFLPRLFAKTSFPLVLLLISFAVLLFGFRHYPPENNPPLAEAAIAFFYNLIVAGLAGAALGKLVGLLPELRAILTCPKCKKVHRPLSWTDDSSLVCSCRAHIKIDDGGLEIDISRGHD